MKWRLSQVREFDGKIRTIFLGNEVPKENIYYTCIACITIDSVMKTDKKNYPMVLLLKKSEASPTNHLGFDDKLSNKSQIYIRIGRVQVSSLGEAQTSQ